MVSIPVLFLLCVMLLANELKAQKNPSNIIELGSRLSPEYDHVTSWMSPARIFAFGFYPQGNGFAIGIWLVGDLENTTVWTANRDGPPVSSDSILQLTNHGRLLLKTDKQEKEEVIADTSMLAASASMLDSGNFVLYDEGFDVIWQTFAFPTDTILGGQNLSSGSQLLSSTSKLDQSRGHFTLTMQDDGNLVACPVNGSVLQFDDYWSTVTPLSYFDQLTLSLGGFLCLRKFRPSRYHVLHNSTDLGKKSTTSIYRATLDTDGIFRLYEHQYEGNASSIVRILWSALSNPCEVKGYCGFNSYCLNSGGASAVCKCFPGLLSSKRSSNMLFDCKKNHSEDGENSTDTMMLYNVTSLEGIWWNDYPYLTIPMEIDACGNSCKEDHNCAAALYVNASCNKYNLPIRYGRRIQNASTVAFYKVPSGVITTPRHSFPSPMSPEVLIDSKRNLILILVVILGSTSCLCLVIVIAIFYAYKNQVYRYKRMSGNMANLGFSEDCTLRSFSFDELAKSTGGFTEEVGRGSFGAVYRGKIQGSNRRIAVRRLERIVEEGEREFRAEITAIARTHHRNLVQLIGFCIEGSRKLLVYEYMSNGSLADLLFNTEMPLSWKDRVRIALDVARGVQYLHEECEVCIIHCNIKPQNILMDEEWTAKISGFGLARLLKPNPSRTTTGVEGVSAYSAPEWQKDASYSLVVKADIYSYGVVLLEIICRRRSIDLNVSSEEIFLSSWVYNCFVTQELNRLVLADEDIDWRSLERMVKIGLWCIQEDPTSRPSMKNVILMLEGVKDIPIPPSPILVV